MFTPRGATVPPTASTRGRAEPILITVFAILLACLVAFVILLSQLTWVGKNVNPFAAALLRVDIMGGVVPIVAYSLAAVALIFSVARRVPLSWRAAVPLAVMLLGAVVAVGVIWMLAVANTLGVGLTNTTTAVTVAVFALVALALWSVFARNHPGSDGFSPKFWRTSISRRLGAILCALAFLLAGTIAVNADFGLDQTPAALAGISTETTVTLPTIAATPTPSPTPIVVKAGGALWANWVAPADMPTAGTITQVSIPNTLSGFTSRPAQLYLPPAALVKDAPPLPLVVLMMGQPGNPDASFAAAALNTLAARNHGLAPIVLTIDQLGNPSNDTLCLNSAKFGNVETFIVEDALNWAHTHLHVLADAAHSTVAGYSAGGQCALYLGAKYPNIWGNVLDISGEKFGGSDRPKQTLAGVFAGNQAAYDASKPLTIMASGAYPNTTAIFTVGSNDSIYRAQALEVSAAARAAGWAATYFEVPNGGHVRVALDGGMAEGFSVLYLRLGLTMPGIAP
jgi:poly(3-hydroxybutyrate) depolymerase